MPISVKALRKAFVGLGDNKASFGGKEIVTAKDLMEAIENGKLPRDGENDLFVLNFEI